MVERDTHVPAVAEQSSCERRNSADETPCRAVLETSLVVNVVWFRCEGGGCFLVGDASGKDNSWVGSSCPMRMSVISDTLDSKGPDGGDVSCVTSVLCFMGRVCVDRSFHILDKVATPPKTKNTRRVRSLTFWCCA